MAPWDSAFAQGGHLMDSEATTADAREQASDGKAVDWLVWALMEHYND